MKHGFWSWIGSRRKQVYDYRSRTEAEEKGYQTHSSDMGGHEQRRQEHTVCEERKKGQNAVESLEPEQLFSAMPPLEASKLLCSLKVSMKTSRKANPLKLAHFDISRAHFMPKPRRELYVELPD